MTAKYKINEVFTFVVVNNKMVYKMEDRRAKKKRVGTVLEVGRAFAEVRKWKDMLIF